MYRSWSFWDLIEGKRHSNMASNGGNWAIDLDSWGIELGNWAINGSSWDNCGREWGINGGNWGMRSCLYHAVHVKVVKFIRGLKIIQRPVSILALSIFVYRPSSSLGKCSEKVSSLELFDEKVTINLSKSRLLDWVHFPVKFNSITGINRLLLNKYYRIAMTNGKPKILFIAI
jgi:hypothetical protein